MLLTAVIVPSQSTPQLGSLLYAHSFRLLSDRALRNIRPSLASAKLVAAVEPSGYIVVEVIMKLVVVVIVLVVV